MIQQTFEDYINRKPDFDGADYQSGRDKDRLTGQIKRVYTTMLDGKWRTLSQISELTGTPKPALALKCATLESPNLEHTR